MDGVESRKLEEREMRLAFYDKGYAIGPEIRGRNFWTVHGLYNADDTQLLKKYA